MGSPSLPESAASIPHPQIGNGTYIHAMSDLQECSRGNGIGLSRPDGVS